MSPSDVSADKLALAHQACTRYLRHGSEAVEIFNKDCQCLNSRVSAGKGVGAALSGGAAAALGRALLSYNYCDAKSDQKWQALRLC